MQPRIVRREAFSVVDVVGHFRSAADAIRKHNAELSSVVDVRPTAQVSFG